MTESQRLLTDKELVKDIKRFNSCHSTILCDVVLADKFKEVKK